LIAGIVLQTGCRNSDRAIAPPGFKPYISKEPFHVLVSDKFPQEQSMMLVSTLNQVAFRLSDTNEKKDAAVSFPGIDANIILNQDNKPEELMLVLSPTGQPTVVFRDINFDGIWDIKMIPSTGQIFIFSDSHWLPVGQVQGHLPNIEAESSQGTFIFDMKKGQWTLKGQ
jgi:hypothetical protein